MPECDILDVFHNITNNCNNDIQIARDECLTICMISVMKGIDICSNYLYDTGLLDQLKNLIKWCVISKYSVNADGH